MADSKTAGTGTGAAAPSANASSLVETATATADGEPLLDGLRYIPNFISSAEAAELIEFIDKQTWNTEYSRRRQFYGYVCSLSVTARTAAPRSDLDLMW